MALIDIQNLNFAYPNSPQRALKNINFSVEAGEFVVICGPSGCGKTTLISQLKREIRPEGEISGRILYRGKPIDCLSKKEAVEEIAMVFQDPENQIVLDTVIHELAFGMENLGYDILTMKKRIGEMCNFFGLEKMLYKSVHELSGGEKQILNLASVLLLQPKLLLLDEPTSQLDPIAAKEFLQMLYRLNRELSMTVIMSEHRLEDLFPLADKVIFMQEGEVKYIGDPKSISFDILRSKDVTLQSYLPSVVRMYSYLKGDIKESEIPIDVREGRKLICDLIDEKQLMNPRDFQKGDKPTEKPIVKMTDVCFRYEKDSPDILKKLSLNVCPGEFLAILGGNGAGKSTLLQIMAGLKKPQRGKVYFKGQDVLCIKEEKRYLQIGYLAQNPMLYFIHETVEDELYKRGEMLKGKVEGIDELLEEYIDFFGLGPLLKRHPYDLSGGEKQKLAMAMVLLSRPQLLLLDEPTKGLDPTFKISFKDILNKLIKSGITIVMVSHDIEFVAANASSCALLFNGEITTKDTPSNFFSENYFYTTAVNRTVREKLPKAITLEDVIKACKWEKYLLAKSASH
ncbi:MAG TPA: ATP-binding cassette domain-containing protein [Tepidanaerobacteraceae bacterium]|nr:ATP-binding cassette domain-containing protein [Tepidanaerobacteraceae bacterium]